jgi:hypothetical protein
MISLKQEYNNAKQQAIGLMNKGLLKEYIEQLKFANNIRLQMIQYNN